MTTENKAHSSAYYLMMVLAVVIGVVLGIGIFVWIISNVTGRVRIPYLLLALPTILLVALVRFIDGALVKRQQASGGLDNQDMAPLVSPYGQAQQRAAAGYGQPGASTSAYGQPGSASGYGQPAYGYSQQPGATAPAYGQAQQPGAQADTPGYSQQPTPGSGSGYGQPYGYGQTPQAGAQSPYGQNGSQL